MKARQVLDVWETIEEEEEEGTGGLASAKIAKTKSASSEFLRTCQIPSFGIFSPFWPGASHVGV